jgi:NADH:ubiquinone oxidoreductase subunit 6 (subunit J)
MQTLEIVRLELLHFGIGLQPFVYVGLLLGALLHYTQGFGSRIRFWACINAIIWVGGIIVCIVQVIGLTNEGIDGRKGSKYPVSDQVIDAAVIAGVYAAIALLEIVLGAWRRTKARGMKSEFQGEDTAEFVNVNLGKGTSHPTDK